MIYYVYTWPWQDVIAPPHLLKSFLPPCCPWFYCWWVGKASSISLFAVDEKHRVTHMLATHRWWWFLYTCPTYPNQQTNQQSTWKWARQSKTIQAGTSLELFPSCFYRSSGPAGSMVPRLLARQLHFSLSLQVLPFWMYIDDYLVG